MANIDLKGDFLDGPELRLLTKLYNGDRQKAIGVVVEFWEVAQRYWIKGQLIPEKAFSFHGFPRELMEQGIELAEVREQGIYAKGSKERFDWIAKRREAARRGGLASAKKRKEQDHFGDVPASVRRAARKKLNAAVAAGLVVRPGQCEACGASEGIQGHHHDYEKPLEVEWLCATCHADAHVELNKNNEVTEAKANQNEASVEQKQPPVPYPVPYPEKEKKNKGLSAPLPWLAELWNEQAGKRENLLFPKVLKVNGQRAKALAARLKENPEESFWQAVVPAIMASKFHRGENDRAWVADFDYLVSAGRAQKIFEHLQTRGKKSESSHPLAAKIKGEQK